MADFPYPTLNMEPAKIVALTESLMSVPVTYQLGAKANPLESQAGDFSSIDCSGFSKWATWHATKATGSAVVIPDGSVNQHEWFNAHGYKKSTFEDAQLKDGAIRIAFLSPESTSEKIGHVMLIVDGQTCESHGHHGVDRRDWGSQGFMSECDVYVLTAPLAEAG